MQNGLGQARRPGPEFKILAGLSKLVPSRANFKSKMTKTCFGRAKALLLSSQPSSRCRKWRLYTIGVHFSRQDRAKRTIGVYFPSANCWLYTIGVHFLHPKWRLYTIGVHFSDPKWPLYTIGVHIPHAKWAWPGPKAGPRISDFGWPVKTCSQTSQF